MPTNPTRRRSDGDTFDESPSIRVLLVDDDDHFRHWLTHLMRRLGFAVEGTLTAYGFKRGRYIDAKLMARLRND